MLPILRLLWKIPARAAAAIEVLNEDASDSEDESTATEPELKKEGKEVVLVSTKSKMKEACPVLARLGLAWAIYFLMWNWEQILMKENMIYLLIILILAIYFCIPIILMIYVGIVGVGKLCIEKLSACEMPLTFTLTPKEKV